MPSKRWKSTSSDRRRWLHMPSWTYGQSTMNFRSSRNFNKLSTEKIAEVRFAFKKFCSPNYELVSMEYLQRVWLASRERLPFRTSGSVPLFGICIVLQLLRQDISNLPCLYSTFHLENPLILSRFRLLLFMATYLLSVFSAYFERKENFDIHFPWYFYRDVWAGFSDGCSACIKKGYFIANPGQFWKSINIRIEFYLFASRSVMKDKGYTLKFRKALRALRNLHVKPLSFIAWRHDVRHF